MVSAPVDSFDDGFFWAGARRGELLIQRCSACGRVRHPPAPMCAACHSTAWDQLRADGRGTVYSWIVSRHPTSPDAEPRTVILVDLEEGIRIVSNLIDHAGIEPATGMAVEVTFVDHGEFSLPQFRPVAAP